MDAPSTASLRVKTITPRLVEIMNRMVLGQPAKQIREEFGITPGRFSIIINSPLFKLELKKKLLKREEIIFDIQENLLEGAKLGSKLYRDILDPTNADGYPTETKLKAANAASTFAVKLINSSNGGNGGNGDESGEGKSYEERLREITVRETIRTVTPLPGEKDQIIDILAENYPLVEEDETPPEADLLFGRVDVEEDFEPLKSIEEVLPKVEQCVSKNDAD